MFTTMMASFAHAAIIAFALLRFGLVCAIAADVAYTLLHRIVGTTDLRDWYAGSMLAVLAVLGALVAYGVRASLEGRPMVRDVNRAPVQPAN